MALVLDTGPLLAALDAADPAHGACAELVVGSVEDLVVPGLVLAELDYWCQKRLGARVWLAFLDDVLAGAYRVEHPTAADLARCRALQETYEDLGLGVSTRAFSPSSSASATTSSPRSIAATSLPCAQSTFPPSISFRCHEPAA